MTKKHDKIVVWEDSEGWLWEYDANNSTTVCRSIRNWPHDKYAAARSARAFAKNLKTPPEVIVQE
ncbi:MAG TPA: hypothetical protein VM223_07285 [Planctomycetota bacterium]|nr:hypothetical protein [Planctomycetota bacterium]